MFHTYFQLRSSLIEADEDLVIRITNAVDLGPLVGPSQSPVGDETEQCTHECNNSRGKSSCRHSSLKPIQSKCDWVPYNNSPLQDTDVYVYGV